MGAGRRLSPLSAKRTSAPALLFEPAAMMPMSAQVGFVLGNHDQVKDAHFNRTVASRTRVPFTGCVGLDGRNDLV